MENSGYSSSQPQPPGLFSTVTDVEIESALAAALTEALAHHVDVTISEMSCRRMARAISFDVTAPKHPFAAQGLRELSDSALASAISETLGELAKKQLTASIHRRRYGFSLSPSKNVLQPVRITVHVEETLRAKIDEHHRYAMSL